jgi:high-affinity Fe2+/Pb2+ permease
MINLKDMGQIFTDFIDNIRSIELTSKGWNYVATPILILAGWYWLGFSNCGVFFQLTGCILFLAAAGLWVTKTEFAKKFWEMMDEESELNEE